MGNNVSPEARARIIVVDNEIVIGEGLAELRRLRDDCVEDGGGLEVGVVLGDSLVDDRLYRFLKHEPALPS